MGADILTGLAFVLLEIVAFGGILYGVSKTRTNRFRFKTAMVYNISENTLNSDDILSVRTVSTQDLELMFPKNK